MDFKPVIKLIKELLLSNIFMNLKHVVMSKKLIENICYTFDMSQ